MSIVREAEAAGGKAAFAYFCINYNSSGRRENWCKSGLISKLNALLCTNFPAVLIIFV